MVLIFLISDENEPFPRSFKILPCGCLSDFQPSSILCCPLLAILGIESRASWMLGILPQSYIPSLRSPFPCVCVWWGGDAFVYACGGQRSGILLYHSPPHLLRIELSVRLEASLDPLLCNDDGVTGMRSHACFYAGAMDLNLSKFYSLSHLHRPLSLGDRISWTLD